MNTRGSCPSLTEPMRTGDGLLARLILYEPIPIRTLTSLCAAAAEHGNGIIEVTQRGSLQVRGLSDASAPKFAHAVSSLEIGLQSGPPLLTSPLLGLEPGELFQATGVVSSLLRMFERVQPDLKSLGAKVSVLLDGGGNLHLDELNADIRLVAEGNSLLNLSLAGDAHNATHLGYVAADVAASAVEVLLRALASRGPTARARDLVREPAIREVRQLLSGGPQPTADAAQPTADAAQPTADAARATANFARPAAEPIGTHPLHDGSVALGFALPFGHTTATTLQRVAQTAADCGASSIRPAPGRALLAIGLSPPAATKLREALSAEGFIVDALDARRHVIACVGAPACTSALLPTRQLAPDVARATQTLVGSSKVIHLAGCSKGCAHPGPAAVTIVGPDRVVLNGRASDPPHARISSTSLVADIAHLCREL